MAVAAKPKILAYVDTTFGPMRNSNGTLGIRVWANYCVLNPDGTTQARTPENVENRTEVALQYVDTVVKYTDDFKAVRARLEALLLAKVPAASEVVWFFDTVGVV